MEKSEAVKKAEHLEFKVIPELKESFEKFKISMDLEIQKRMDVFAKTCEARIIEISESNKEEKEKSKIIMEMDAKNGEVILSLKKEIIQLKARNRELKNAIKSNEIVSVSPPRKHQSRNASGPRSSKI